MYQALYRTLRPEVFSHLLGQEHIVRILQNQLGNDGVSHAYLFCGTRGTGKTSTARLLAKGVNCLSEEERPCGHCANCESIRQGTFVDVIEMDAASNRGIDNIRELRESVKYPPAVGRKKVYIIDEVHMLSTEAFNALLKTLEEPPQNVMFILATTEPQKLPATILSRCMRLDFRRIPQKQMEERLGEILREQGVDAEDGAISLIATNADGSVRDGLSLLDQLLATGTKYLTREQVLDLLGAASTETLWQLVEYLHQGDLSQVLLQTENLVQEGRDIRQVIKDLITYYRGLLLAKYLEKPEDLLNLSTENGQRLREQSKSMTLEDIRRGVLELAQASLDARYSTHPRVLLEVALMKLGDKEIAHGGRIDQEASGQWKKAPQPAPAEKKVADKTEEVKTHSTVMPTGAATENPRVAPLAENQQKSEKTVSVPQDIWDQVLDRLEQEKATFRMMRGTSQILEMRENRVVLEGSSEMAVSRLQGNQAYIAEILEQITGLARELEIREKQDESVEEKKGTPVETVTQLSDLMGEAPLIIQGEGE
ncbi:MAG: DNA polymerase III subunit gamma/tau [Anaerovoracaceae bacterium]